MKHMMRKTMLLAVIVISSTATPIAAAYANPRTTNAAPDQLEKDRNFARNLRDLKDRQHREWNTLLERQQAETTRLQDKTSGEQRILQRRQAEEKNAMKSRHKKELEELKAEYKG